MAHRRFPILHLVFFLALFVPSPFIVRADGMSVDELAGHLQQKHPMRTSLTDAHLARQVSKDPSSSEDKKGPKKDDVTVQGIKFQAEEDGSEKVFIRLNRFYWPNVFVLEGDKPRLVIDVENVSSWKGTARMPVKGKMIRQIRTHLWKTQGKLRIVLDLDPDLDYVVSRVLSKADNILCLTVRRQTKATQEPK